MAPTRPLQTYLKNPRCPRNIWNKLSIALVPLFFVAQPRMVLTVGHFAGTMAIDREKQFATEFQTLCKLCDEAFAREQRHNLLQTLEQETFLDPEHQVVFESIRALFPRGPITMAQLRIHLNNRGFPDTDVEKYFQSAPAENIHHAQSGNRTP